MLLLGVFNKFINLNFVRVFVVNHAVFVQIKNKIKLYTPDCLSGRSHLTESEGSVAAAAFSGHEHLAIVTH